MTTNLLTRERAILEVRRIAAKAKEPDVFREVAMLVEGIFDSRTPSHRIDLSKAKNTFSIYGLGAISDDEKEALLLLQKAIEQVLLSRGYREDKLIFTRQEHELLGSSVLDIEDPYTPIGLLRRELTLEEIVLARRLKLITDVFGEYFGSVEIYVPAALELLDEQGRTIRDPRVLDMTKLEEALRTMSPEQALDAAAIIAQRSADFPFRRD